MSQRTNSMAETITIRSTEVEFKTLKCYNKTMSKNDTMTPEKLKALKEECLETLCAVRQKLLVRQPFIGGMAMKMNLIPVRDKRCRTACTDDNNIFFDLDFFSKLSLSEVMFVMAHEIWHVIMLHLVRLQSRDPDLFNIATDKEVNRIISEDSSGDMTPPKDVLFPTQAEQGLSAEEIYERLIQNMKRKAKKQSGGQGNGNQKNSQQGQKNPGNSNPSGDDGENGDDGDDGNGNSKNDSNAGGKEGKLKGQFDRHVYNGKNIEEQENSNDGQDGQNGQNGQDGQDKNGKGKGKGNGNGGGGGGDVSDQWGSVGYDDDFCPNVSPDAADRIRERVIAEAQRVERTRGTLPGAVESIIAQYRKPEIKWQEVLAKFVTKCYNTGNRVWCPPNRRHVYNDLYLQSRRSEKIKVCVCVDTSGAP